MKQRGEMKKIFSLMLVLAMVITGIVSVKHIAMASEGDVDDCAEVIVEKLDISTYREESDKNEKGYYADVPKCKTEGYIFAGWYETEYCDDETKGAVKPVSTSTTTGEKFAKFVPEHVLTVKGQIHKDTYTVEGDSTSYRDLRVVTSLDSLWYDQVGFEITINGSTLVTTEVEGSANSVYKQLYYVGKTDGEYYSNYTPEGTFCAMSHWFKTWTITGIPETAWNAEIAATPFWVTMDGTIVKSENTVKNVNEGIYKSVDSTAFEARIDNYYYGELEAALADTINSDSAEITLLNNISVDNGITLDGTKSSSNITLVNEKNVVVTISRTDDYTSNMFKLNSGVSLTIQGTDVKGENNVATDGIVIDGKEISENSDGESAVNQLIVCDKTNAGGKLDIQNVTIKDAYGSAGAAIRVYAGTLNVSNCQIQNIKASNIGGAILLDGNSATVDSTISNTIFSNNGTVALVSGEETTTYAGGAIYARQSGDNTCDVTITDCCFTNNIPEGANGGAIYNNGASITISNCNFGDATVEDSGNGSSSANGGAIYNNAGTTTITASDFYGNIATNGGAIYGNAGTITVAATEFNENTASTSGGAIYNNATANITMTDFNKNNAITSGGAIFINDGTVTLTGSEIGTSYISENTSSSGGAITFTNNAGALEVTNYTFEVNEATANGGAIQVNSEATIKNCTFDSNTAGNVGGSIFVTSATGAKITSESDGNAFSGNSAKNGGAIYYRNATEANAMDVNGWKFNDNSASQSGGAVYVNTGTMTLDGAEFANNTAITSGEAVYVSAGKTINLSNCDFAGDNDTSEGEVALGMTAGDTEYTVATANVSGKVTDVAFTYSGYSSDLTVPNGVCVSETAITSGSDIKIVPYKYEADTQVLFGTLTDLDNTELACFDATPPSDGTHLGINSEGKLEQVAVAQIGDTSYNSWSEAVTAIASSAESTIYLLDDFVFNTQLAISKNVAVQPYNKDITIYKNSTYTSNLFKTNANTYTMTIGSSDGFGITIDARTAEQAIAGEEYSSSMSAQLINCGNLTMTNVTVQHALISAAGTIRANGTLNMANCKFIGNKNTGNNGGGVMYLGEISGKENIKTITGTEFINNTSTLGGVFNIGKDEQTVSISDCTFSGNTATSTGGAIHFGEAAKCTISGSTFTGNESTTHGGVFYSNVASTCTLTNCDFDSNVSVNHGGVIRAGNSSSFTVINCDFTNNVSGSKENSKNGNGAAIYTAGAATVSLLVDDSVTHVFENNMSWTNSDGSIWGAIAHGSSNELQCSAYYTFEGNTNGYADGELGKGVGCYNDTAGDVIVLASNYVDLVLAINSAEEDVATTIVLTDDIAVESRIDCTDKNVVLMNEAGTPVTITKTSTISDSNLFLVGEGTSLVIQGAEVDGRNGIVFDGENTAAGSGGAILYATEGSLTLKNATIKNGYKGAGAAIRINKGSLIIDNCLFKDNEANNIGGAILIDGNSNNVEAAISNSEFDGNSTNKAIGASGAIHVRSKEGKTCDVTITSCVFTNNTDTEGTSGEDIYVGGTASVTVDGVEITEKDATTTITNNTETTE